MYDVTALVPSYLGLKAFATRPRNVWAFFVCFFCFDCLWVKFIELIIGKLVLSNSKHGPISFFYSGSYSLWN